MVYSVINDIAHLNSFCAFFFKAQTFNLYQKHANQRWVRDIVCVLVMFSMSSGAEFSADGLGFSNCRKAASWILDFCIRERLPSATPAAQGSEFPSCLLPARLPVLSAPRALPKPAPGSEGSAARRPAPGSLRAADLGLRRGGWCPCP